jgi:hypothetical protein
MWSRPNGGRELRRGESSGGQRGRAIDREDNGLVQELVLKQAGARCTSGGSQRPILERFLSRLRLHEFLHDHLPREDGRTRVPTATAWLALPQNLLIAREPLYGVLSRDGLESLNGAALPRSCATCFRGAGAE